MLAQALHFATLALQIGTLFQCSGLHVAIQAVMFADTYNL
jgi:hypothetical protein